MQYIIIIIVCLLTVAPAPQSLVRTTRLALRRGTGLTHRAC